MGALIDAVRAFADQHRLWTPATRVAAAVSGGSDSVALLFLLRELASSGHVQLAGLIHLNHHIRGSASDADAAFCRALADRLGIAAVIGDADVPARAARDGVSIEVGGRDARQEFFLTARESLGVDRIAVAHTRDDQAETVLLRLTRGAGPAGLAGIAPSRDHLIRPLLSVSREELRAYLNGRGETWREDETNLDRAIPRNLIRHDVLPALRTLNARVDVALARTADILRNDAALLDQLANEAAARLVVVEGDHVRLDGAALAALPPALQTRVAIVALETANPGRSYGLEEAKRLLERLDGDGVLVLGRVLRVPRVQQVQQVQVLQVPGEVREELGGWTLAAEGPLNAEGAFKAEGRRQKAEPTQAVIDAALVGTVLNVRGRRAGDRLQPLGAPGHRKLQDVLVDRKVPRDERDRVPIVTDQTGQIVWVAGHVLAEPFRVTPLTKSVVVLTLRSEK